MTQGKPPPLAIFASCPTINVVAGWPTSLSAGPPFLGQPPNQADHPKPNPSLSCPFYRVMLMRRTRSLTVNHSGANGGSVVCGCGLNNRGLRLQVLQDQTRGNDGTIEGRFLILAVGDNEHSKSLKPLLYRATNAQEVHALVRQRHPRCENLANANVLVVEEVGESMCLIFQEESAMVEENGLPAGVTGPTQEPGNAPEREPGNRWVTPEAERPPKREPGTVSDPDQFPAERLPPKEGQHKPEVGTVSNPD